ncbi:MAG: hypothetical protein M3Q36_00305, partial [bacterium]|nr:hypothetical protein [bacterium]
MSEAAPQYSNELNLELEKIQSPVERAAFEFFYNASAKEDFDMPPAYTWDKFDRGIAAFNGLPISYVDMVAGKFIPNYTEESCQENGLENVVPMLDALKGPFVQSVHKARQKGSVRIIANHPTIATPYLVARSLAEAYMEAYAEDIRPFIYVVEGAYPTVLKYRLREDDGSVMEISPVDLGMSLANLLLTAPRTENTKSDDTAVKEWMRASRANFRVSNHEILLPSNS